jgi:hypothetical protein
VVRGLVGDAVIMAMPADDDARNIADVMGATLVTQTNPKPLWQDAAASARGRAVILLAAGDVLIEPWIGVIERHMASEMALPKRLERSGLGVWHGLWASVTRHFSGRTIAPGLIAARLDVIAGALPSRPRKLSARIEIRKD